MAADTSPEAANSGHKRPTEDAVNPRQRSFQIRTLHLPRAGSDGMNTQIRGPQLCFTHVLRGRDVRT